MKRFSILHESPRGIRTHSGYILVAPSKSFALTWARELGCVGKLLALEIVDVEERAA